MFDHYLLVGAGHDSSIIIKGSQATAVTYLHWLVFFVWAPIAVLWLTHYRVLWPHKKTILFCAFWALVFSVPWDLWAVSTRIWLFPSDTNSGVWIGGLPLEEYFFIIFVTILISTITLLVRHYAKSWRDKEES